LLTQKPALQVPQLIEWPHPSSATVPQAAPSWLQVLGEQHWLEALHSMLDEVQQLVPHAGPLVQHCCLPLESV
jgi:hypothetical protein